LREDGSMGLPWTSHKRSVGSTTRLDSMGIEHPLDLVRDVGFGKSQREHTISFIAACAFTGHKIATLFAINVDSASDDQISDSVSNSVESRH
jgi:hypothetical protein